MQADVVVVGAGPTGLLLATELGLAGVSTIVVERLAERSGQSKAGNLQPRSVEVLDLRGLLDPLLGRGLGEPVAHGGHFALLPVVLSYEGWPTRHRYQIQIPQVLLEMFLEEQLAARDIPLLRPLEVTGLEQEAEGVVATAAGPDGDLELRARYLVGCDGAHSTVRKLVHAAFPGRRGTLSAVLADVVLAPNTGGSAPAERRHLSQHVRAGTDVWAVLMPWEDGVWRFLFGGPEQQGVARDAPVTHAEVHRALHASHGPDVELQEVRFASRFTDASRQVEQYRSGRVLLAGDAAHVHLPLGGQGMNLGLQDAFNLGWKLAGEVHGWAPQGLLDTYHTERHPVGARVLQSTRAQGALNRQDEDSAELRAVFCELMQLSEANRHLAGMVSGLDIRYEMPGAAAHPQIGRWLPDLELGTARGGCRVSGLMHAGRGLLLEVGGEPAFGQVAARWAARVDHVVARTDESVDVAAVLVRPDGHVCWVAPGPEKLEDALALWFGPVRSSRDGRQPSG